MENSAVLTAATGMRISTNRPASACLISLSFTSRKYWAHSCLTNTDTQNKTYNISNANLHTNHSRETCKCTVLVTEKDVRLLKLSYGLHTQTRWLEKYEVYYKIQHLFAAIGSIKISGLWCLLNAAHIERRISLPITG